MHGVNIRIASLHLKGRNQSQNLSKVALLALLDMGESGDTFRESFVLDTRFHDSFQRHFSKVYDGFDSHYCAMCNDGLAQKSRMRNVKDAPSAWQGGVGLFRAVG